MDANDLKFMTVVDNDDRTNNSLAAITSTTYGRIWDAEVALAALDIQARTNGKFYNPKAYDPGTGKPVPSGLYASDRDIFIFMIDGGSMLDAGPRAQLNRGFFLSNSEVGSRTFTVTTFLFNVVCGNHIVWGAQDVREVSIRHNCNAPRRFITEAMPGLLAYSNSSATTEIAKIRKASDFLIEVADREQLVAWLRARKFTKTEAEETIDFANREEGDCRTLWQLIQGATAYARGFEHLDARVELETKAGNLMNILG